MPNIKQVSCAGDYVTLVDKEGKVFIMGPSKVKGINQKENKQPTDIIQLDINDKIERVESGLNFSMGLNS